MKREIDQDLKTDMQLVEEVRYLLAVGVVDRDLHLQQVVWIEPRINL